MRFYIWATIALLVLVNLSFWIIPGSPEDQGITLGASIGVLLVFFSQKKYLQEIKNRLLTYQAREFNRSVFTIGILGLIAVGIGGFVLFPIISFKPGFLAALLVNFVSETVLLLLLVKVSLRIVKP